MFKSWQIFVFSLVPLALVFAGVILGSVTGSDSELEVFPTQPPSAENGENGQNGGGDGGPTGAPPSGSVGLQLVAVNITFEPETLSADAGAPVFLEMDNQDAGVPHNFSLYADRGYTQAVFTGDLVTGVVTENYEFDAPSTPGEYYFRCDVHPDTMTGVFNVN